MLSYLQEKLISRPAAYSYIILQLELFQKQLPDSAKDLAKELASFIEKMKIVFENHEPDISALAEKLVIIHDMYEEIISSEQKQLLLDLAGLIIKTPFLNPNLQQRHEDEFQRQFESIFAINLSTNPTDAMMESVGHVSLKIIEFLVANKSFPMKELITDCSYLSRAAERFGVSTDKNFSEEKLLDILDQNKKSDLIKIICIHYVFWSICKRAAKDKNLRFDFPRWENKPVGHFADYVRSRLATHGIDHKEYLLYIPLLSSQPNEVAHLSDEIFYASPLYKNRGRKGPFDLSKSFNREGIMLENQDVKNLQRLANRRWLIEWGPDVLGQAVDFEAYYVINLLMNDGVYVSGSSGMISILLSLMEIMGNFPDISSKQHYLSASISFIVSGGFHCMHEVLEPAQWCLKLVPGYNASVLSKSEDFRSAPPNYHVFFDLFAKDAQFKALREKAWNDFLTTFVALKFNLKSGLIAVNQDDTQEVSLRGGRLRFLNVRRALATQQVTSGVGAADTAPAVAASAIKSQKK